MSHLPISDDGSAQFFVRWRGRQEGPYPVSTIEEKLAANQIGLLHEIFYRDQWVTLRDFFAEQEAKESARRQAQEDEQRQRLEAERQASDREERFQADLLAEEKRKNDLLQSSIIERQRAQTPIQPVVLKSHRAGTILALGIIGLLVCGPLCIAAWLMGDNDIREMDASIMDNSGRATTATGRTLGIIGTILWIIGIIVFVIL
jgi:hypothetical protein